MSSIDERIVQMELNNKGFQSAANETLKTLDGLNKALKLDNASKGFSDVDKAAKNVKLDGLANNVQSISDRFTNLGIIGVTVLQNITNSAINAGKQMLSSLTLGPIIQGFQEYETQINAVQTILANTSSKGTTIDQVNTSLDELNEYADKTIYNFAEMTRNIGTFTAAGVDLDTAVYSIQGIANLAAASGSNSTQAATAMYQLSQAIAAGRVQLMDWNSVVNAGMGGEMFQNALKRTAEHFGVNVDAMIEKYGSFRESLTQGGWLNSDILTETLKQLSGAYTEADLIAQGYTEDQAREIVELANTATDAATKVKTFTQLWQTTLEALGSGWAQSFEIIIGDFEEAKALLTDVSNVVTGAINDMSNARNEMLQGWSDLGGRQALIDALRKAFEGLVSVMKPIGEAFNEVFPPMSAQNLYDMTINLKNFTEGLVLSEDAANDVKNVFKGLFSIFKTVGSIIGTIAGAAFQLLGAFAPLAGAVIKIIGAIGSLVSSFTNAISTSGIFQGIIEGITGVIAALAGAISGLALGGVGAFFDGLAERITPLEGIAGSLGGLASSIGGALAAIAGSFAGIGEVVSEVFAQLTTAITDAEGNLDFNAILDILNSGLITGILALIADFIFGMKENADEGGGIKDSIMDLLDGVGESLNAFTNAINAKALMSLAGAIAILAGSLLVLSTIDSASLTKALVGLTAIFAELFAALMVFAKVSNSFGVAGMIRLAAGMTILSVAVAILTGAVKSLSGLDWDGLAKGLVGVGVLMLELTGASALMSKVSGGLIRTSAAMVIYAAALNAMAAAVKTLGSMDTDSVVKGLVSMAAILIEIAAFSKLIGNPKGMMSTAVGLVVLGAAMNVFASAVQTLGGMQLEQIGTGLLGMGGALAIIAAAIRIMPKNLISSGAGLLVISVALQSLSGALKSMGGMSWEDLGKSLATLGGSLVILAAGLRAMSGGIAGAAALTVASAALNILATALKALGGMSLVSVATALGTLAGALTILGVAAKLLTPAIPSLIALAGAITLFGAGIGLAGAGILALGAGLTMLAAAGAGAAAAITAALSAVIGLIPALATALAEGFLNFLEVIASGGAQIVAAVSTLIQSVVEAIATNGPLIIETAVNLLMLLVEQIAEKLPEIAALGLQMVLSILQTISENMYQIVQIGADIVVNFINGLASKLPDIINAAFNFIIQFINGLAQAINENKEALGNAAMNLAMTIITAFAEGISGLAGQALEAIGNLFSSITGKITSADGSFFSNAFNTARNIITGIVNSISSGIGNALSALGSLISSIANSISNAASNFLNTAMQIGSNIIDGIVQGIQSAPGAVASALGSVVNGAIDQIKSTLGIASPSKLMKKLFGYVIDGAILGVENNESKLKNAFYSMAQTAAEEINKLLNEDYPDEYNPKFIPVFDFDNIPTFPKNGGGSASYSTAKQINRAINNQPNKLSEYQAAMQASNAEVIGAISKLNDNLSKYYENDDKEITLYVDGKKLASTTAYYMNKQLGVLSKRGGIS